MNKSAPKAQNTKAEATAATDPVAIIRSLWLGTCARYTVLCLILLVTSAIASDSLTVTYVDTVRFFLLLPFGISLTLAAWVRRSDKLSTGAKVGLHALATLGGFYLFCYLPYQVRTPSRLKPARDRWTTPPTKASSAKTNSTRRLPLPCPQVRKPSRSSASPASCFLSRRPCWSCF